MEILSTIVHVKNSHCELKNNFPAKLQPPQNIVISPNVIKTTYCEIK